MTKMARLMHLHYWEAYYIWRELQIWKFYNKRLSMSQILNDIWRQALVLESMSSIWPDYPRRISYYKKAIALFRKVGDWYALARDLSDLAKIEVLTGDFDAAQKNLERGYSIEPAITDEGGYGKCCHCP